ncbi:MAG: ABC transporter permease, partial [Gammaproteobacteria bacterium]
MMFHPYFLWTDTLFWVLVVVAASFAIYASRKPHLRVPWRQVARSKTGAVSAIVLLAFLLVAMLDSVHFRPDIANGQGGQVAGNQVLSVLDYLTADMRKHVERTYSAPFATHSFEKETVDVNGVSRRINPPLQWGGRHLSAQQDKWRDVLQKSARAGVTGVIIWAALAVLLVLAISAHRRQSPVQVTSHILRGRTELPWRTILLTLLVVISSVVILYELSRFYHVFGTDKVGKDVLLQSVKSIRTGLLIGTLTTLVMLPFAIALGIMAGYFGKWVDDLIQYLYTTLSSIPGVLLIAAAILSLQVYMANHPGLFETATDRNDLRLLFLTLILGITSWTGLCRLLRGETLKLRELDYVQAAQGFGVSHARIITRHILPNVMHVVLITVVLDFSGLVLAEAVLSYIGIGVDPSMDSWGNMINRARLEMAREPVV